MWMNINVKPFYFSKQLPTVTVQFRLTMSIETADDICFDIRLNKTITLRLVLLVLQFATQGSFLPRDAAMLARSWES